MNARRVEVRRLPRADGTWGEIRSYGEGETIPTLGTTLDADLILSPKAA